MYSGSRKKVPEHSTGFSLQFKQQKSKILIIYLFCVFIFVLDLDPKQIIPDSQHCLFSSNSIFIKVMMYSACCRRPWETSRTDQDDDQDLAQLRTRKRGEEGEQHQDRRGVSPEKDLIGSGGNIPAEPASTEP